MVGQTLAHFYSARRDRREQLADAIDKAVAAFVAADRAALTLINVIQARGDRDAVTAAAESLTDHEVAMRAAVLSVSIRRPVDNALATKLMNAHQVFFRISKIVLPSARPATPLGDVKAAVVAARAKRDEFLEQLSEGLELARKEMGQKNPW